MNVLLERLKTTLGTNLKSVVLYGSAAANDQSKTFSNINLLVVVDTLSGPILHDLRPQIKSWIKAGNPAPQFMTEKTVHNSTDVFPLEFLDIQSNHRILYGTDLFKDLPIKSHHLQHQLEFELRSKLFFLRQRYLEIDGDSKQVLELVAKSISSLTVLFKGVLMLLKEPAPAQKKEIWTALSKHVPIDQEVFDQIWQIRQGTLTVKNIDIDDLYSRLLTSVEMVIRFVDQQK